MGVGDITSPPPAPTATERIASWWREAELAARSQQPARARRYLRWILVCNPDDEEAWLWLARLAASRQARLAYLRHAYLFHPNSARVQAALRQVRAEQLESAVGDLRPQPGRIRCLPDDRHPTVSAGVRPVASALPSIQLPRVDWRAQALSVRAALAPGTLDLPAWLAFLLPLLAYLFTACSTVYNLDSAEFSAAVHVLGIVRSTGYPLYLLLGKVFTTLLPVGDVAFRLNVMSAVCAAGTVVLLYQLLRRLTGQRAAALAASLLYAFSYYFWAQAVVAEVYTLHTLLMAALFLLLLRWEATHSDWLLAASVLLYGLSFGNHLSTLLLAPGIVAFILLVGGKEILRPKRVALLLACFAAGLSIYVYVPLRYLAQPTFNYAGRFDAQGQFVPLDMTRPSNLWWLVSGQGFQDLMFDYSAGELVGEIGQAAYRLWATFLGIGLVPGLLGIGIQARRRPRHLALFGLAFVANVVFFVNYRVVDKASMFVPAYLVGAVWVGEGYAWLVAWVNGRQAVHDDRSPTWAWGLAALAALALVVNWPLVDVHADTRARDRAQAALAGADPEAIIFGWWTSAPPMHYQQLVQGQRPDVLVINRFLIGAEEMYTLIDHSLGQRPVYVMELDEGLLGAYRPVPVGPMFELTPRELAESGP